MPKKTRTKESTVPKTKEQLLAEIRRRADFKERMAFVKGQFWPALKAASTSIEDASILLSGFNNVIMQEFLGLMKQKTVFDLNLVEKLDPKSDKAAEHKALLSLFLEKSVFEAKELIEGMKNEIAQFQLDEMRERTLDTLKTKWIDEL